MALGEFKGLFERNVAKRAKGMAGDRHHELSQISCF